MSSIEVAAWVQAIGSVVAIASGFAFYFVQHAHQRHVRGRALWGLLIMVSTFNAGLKAYSGALKTNGEWSGVLKLRTQWLASMRHLFNRLDLNALPDPDIWMALVMFTAQFEQFAEEIATNAAYASTHDPNAPFPGNRSATIAELCDAMQEVTDRLSEKAYG